MNYFTKKNDGSSYLMLTIMAVVIIIPLSFWTDRSLDYLGQWIKNDNSFNMPYYISLLATIIGNGVVFIFNIIMEIIKLIRIT